MGKKLLFMWSRDQCSTKREKRFHFSVGLGFGIRLGLGYDSGYWLRLGFGLESGFGSEIRVQTTGAAKVMSRDCSMASDLVKANQVTA